MDGTRFDALTKGLARGTSRRKLLRGLIGGGAALVTAKTGTTLAAKEPKVTICHFPPENPENVQIIEVSANAVNAHIANHGDQYWCPGDLCMTGNECCSAADCDDEKVCTNAATTGHAPIQCYHQSTVRSLGGVRGARVPRNVVVEHRRARQSLLIRRRAVGSHAPNSAATRTCNEQPCITTAPPYNVHTSKAPTILKGPASGWDTTARWAHGVGDHLAPTIKLIARKKITVPLAVRATSGTLIPLGRSS